MEAKEKKRAFGYFTFLTGWVIVTVVILMIALIWFYRFLENYQKVFDQTRPIVYQNEIMKLFESKDAAQILEQAESVVLGPFEIREHFEEFLNDYLEGKEMTFAPKKGEHTEESPVYVVLADAVPFAIVRLNKKAEMAQYGMPLWEKGSIEILPIEAQDYKLLAPDSVTVTVNGIAVTKEALEQDGIRGDAEEYVEKYIQIPSYSRYDLGQMYREPEIVAVNSAGENVDVVYDEKEHCYKAGFGGDKALRAEMEEYVVQMAVDYAMYMSNDAPNASLDKYFPPGSALLRGIKQNWRHWYDNHLRPEVKNIELQEFIVYSPDAFCAKVYLEQHMYVPYSKKTQIVVTDRPIYFVKIDGAWKVSGIAFR